MEGKRSKRNWKNIKEEGKIAMVKCLEHLSYNSNFILIFGTKTDAELILIIIRINFHCFALITCHKKE
jgi:hypothetical protein